MSVTYMVVTKKMRVLALFICLVLLFPTFPVQAEDAPLIGVSIVYEEKRGKTVDIGIYINSEEKVASGSLDLLYDETLLTVEEVEMGDLLSSYLTSSNSDQAGKISLTWAQAKGEVLDGTLLTVSVELSKKIETAASLNLENVQLYREDGSKINVQLLNGEIKPFKGEEKKHNSKVNGNKEWTISLNHELNPATINKHTVRVKDSDGNLVDVLIKTKTSKSFTVTPKNKYISGTYTLEISEQVRSLKGSKLKNPIKFEFSVE